MFSFIINSISVIIGSIIGLVFKSKIKKEVCDQVLKGLGLVVIVFGVSGAISNIELVNYGLIIVIICISLGSFIGEALKLEKRLNNFSERVEKKFNKGKLSEGFVAATTLFCVGAMSIIGTLEACFGDYNTILIKSGLDFISSIVLASTLGFGVALSFIGVFVYQGLLTLIFMLVKNNISMDVATNLAVYLNMVGYIMILGIGVNFFLKDKIKIVNLLPSLVLVSIYFGVVLWLG